MVARGRIEWIAWAVLVPVAAIGLLRLGAALAPLPEQELRSGFSESRRIYDRLGVLLREVVNDQGARARWTPLEQISPAVIEATIAVEDERFWAHGGVDAVAVARAAAQNTSSQRVVSGASTLTMQLARLLRGHRHTFAGKLGQALDALRIEAAIDKQTILEQYLNRAPYGAGTVGVEAASRRYFAKPSMHLSLAEAALLAGLPQAPSMLNPLRDPEAAKVRQRIVLERLHETGRIDTETLARALAEPLVFEQRLEAPAAMHFTDWLLSEGLPPGDVRTTLDAELQKQVERLVREHVRALEAGGLTNAAVVVLDNRSCELRVMVGSSDYWRVDGGSVNGATARRQPGSALKPFLYALAFTRRFSPASVVADVETQYPGSDGTLLEPRNYSERFSGPVLVHEALGRSLNVPAIRVANEVGIEDLLVTLHELGFASLDRSAGHYGLGLTLGNGEVTLVELAQAYAILARGGMSCQATSRADVPVAGPRRVFSPEVSFLVSDILADEGLRIRAFGAGNPLVLGFPMSVKTGTSGNWRDSWAVGFTDRFTLAVWTGDFQGRPMHRLSGAAGAGPLFARVARLLVGRGVLGRRPAAPVPPAGVEQVLVCALSGQTPTEHCPHVRAVHVLADHRPTQACTWHRPIRTDRRNGLLASDRCPSRFVDERVFEMLPPAYAKWQAEHATRAPPTRYSPLCPADGLTARAVVITSPRQGDVFVVEPGYVRATQSVRLSAEVDPALPLVTWLVDGEMVAAAGWPYDAAWQLETGRHTLTVVAGDMRADPVEFEVR
jgi:penicillin-binding protein 1C